MKIFHRAKPLSEEQKLLLEEINDAKLQMEIADINFQDALDPDLIDYYIYEGNAAWKKYCFLIRQAKLF